MMWNFKNYEERVAIRDESGSEITYGQLSRYGDEIAEAAGGRVLIFCFCENHPGSIIGYAGMIQHEIVPVLLNAELEEELRTDLIDRYQPAFFWIPERMGEVFPDAECVYACEGYELRRNPEGVRWDMHPDLALLLTTSGSTGSPKFVRQSYENIRSNTEAIVEYLELDETERAITTLPMNYTYGLSIINTHLYVGATLLTTEKTLMQKEFWAFFKEGEATSFGGVPYTYEMLHRLRFFRMDLPALRYMTQAGGKLTPELHRKFAEYAEESGKKFIVMYGQCEATARMGYLPAKDSLAKFGSMGIPIPGGKFVLIDVEGNAITEPEISGELVYEGPNVTLGYAEKPEDLAKGDERGGRLQTGDMAKFDEDGFYYIVGRKKRFLKIFGNRVNLDEVDRMVKTRFDNIDCASGGVDDKLFIFLVDEEMVEPVRQLVIDKTGLNHIAIKVMVLDEIPKNDSGKVRYKELEQYYPAN